MDLTSRTDSRTEKRTQQALIAWGVFFVLAVLINGTVPFILGYDLQEWTNSITKVILFSLIIYAGLFLVVPLVSVKGWHTFRQPSFLIPVLIAMVGIVLWRPIHRYTAIIVVIVLAYLHWRFDLSELGFQSYGIKGDISAILLIGVFSVLAQIAQGMTATLMLNQALLAGLARLFGNPASTVENLFYFGFLAESLSRKTGMWLTPVLVGLLYTLHEMSNPEYWYSHQSFGSVFIVISMATVVYLWRRNILVIWLGDGLTHFVTSMF